MEGRGGRGQLLQFFYDLRLWRTGMDGFRQPLKCNGGEGGIRTPDSLATMSDFESGAFNRALPPLRVLSRFKSGD